MCVRGKEETESLMAKLSGVSTTSIKPGHPRPGRWLCLCLPLLLARRVLLAEAYLRWCAIPLDPPPSPPAPPPLHF